MLDNIGSARVLRFSMRKQRSRHHETQPAGLPGIAGRLPACTSGAEAPVKKIFLPALPLSGLSSPTDFSFYAFFLSQTGFYIFSLYQ